MEQWLPGVKRRPASYGSGNKYLGGTPKVVWHTTESDPGTIEGNLNYAEGVGYGPHLWYDPSTGEMVQVLPLGTPATALYDPQGTGTNRAGEFVLQIEVIGRAARAPLAHGPLKNLDKIMEWVRSGNVPDRFPAGVPTGLSGDRSVYAAKSPGGHYTHSQIPLNTHVDPGKIDADLLFGVQTGDAEMEEYITGQAAARDAYAKDGKIGDPPKGQAGRFFRAGWNDVRWSVNNLKGKDGKPGPKGDPGVQGLPGATHTHTKVSVAGPAVAS